MLLTRRVCLLVLVGFALAVVVVPITLFVGDDDDSTLLVLRGSVASATPSVEHRVSLVPSPRPLTVAPPTTSRPPATSAPARSRAATYTPLSPELSSRVHRWANGTAFVDEPLPDTTGLIPRRLFLTWKATVLPLQAANLLQTWQTEEPQLEIIVVDDADCAALAERFLRLKPRYDALPMNVMRADICRVLLIYFFGGLYKDLDVQWAVSLDKWLAWTSPVEYGLEDEEHVCQWFFAARPGNPCIRHVLQHITNIIESLTEIDFNQHVEAVIEYTGPGAFTDGMRGCPTQAKFSVEEMRRTNIIHQYAAAQWTQSGYASWLEERKLKAGWQGIWAAGLTLDYFVLQPQSRFTQVGPDDRFPPLTLQRVKMSSVQWSNDYFFGPHLAFDGSLDTSIVSNVGTFQWLEIRFAKPMTIGTVAAASEDHLCGMRIYNGKRPHLNQEFNDGVVIELYSPRGRLVMVTTKRTGTVTNHFIAFGGVKDVIQRIRVVRAAADTRLVLSEVQLFSDPALRRYRRTVLNWTIADMDHPYVPLVAHLLHVNHTVTDRVVVTNEPRCPHSTGVSLGNRFLFALCSPPGEIKPCAAVILSDKAKGMTIDDSFAHVMHRSCAMLAFAPVAPHANTVTMHTVITPWNCSNASNGTACESLELAQRKVVQMEARTVSVLLDLEESDWGRDDSLIRWIVEGPLKADTLLIEVRVGTVASRQARRHLERLSMRYRLVAWYPVVDDGYYEPLPRLLMPRTVQTTWVVRQEVPRSS